MLKFQQYYRNTQDYCKETGYGVSIGLCLYDSMTI